MNDERNWQAQQDIRILQEAKMIESDANRMAAAKQAAEQQAAALKAITGDNSGTQMKQTNDGMLIPQFRPKDGQ